MCYLMCLKFIRYPGDLLSILYKYEDKVNRFVGQLVKRSIIPANDAARLKTRGSRPGIMYGLPIGSQTFCSVTTYPVNCWHLQL